MDLIASIPITIPSQNNNLNSNPINATILNPTEELLALKTETILNGVITNINKLKTYIDVYAQNLDGKIFNLQIKTPLIPTEGTEVTIKINPIIQKNPENLLPVKIFLNPKSNTDTTQKTPESLLQKEIYTKTLNNSENKSIPIQNLEKAISEIKGNNITAEVLYTNKNIPYSSDKQSLLNQNKQNLISVFQDDNSWIENPLPLNIVKKGSSLNLKIIQIDIPKDKINPNILNLDNVNASNPQKELAIFNQSQNNQTTNNLNNKQNPLENNSYQTFQNTKIENNYSLPQKNNFKNISYDESNNQPLLKNDPLIINSNSEKQNLTPQKNLSINEKIIISQNPNNIKNTFTISSQIVSKPDVPHTIVANQQMTISLNIKTDFPTGTFVKMEVLSLQIPELNIEQSQIISPKTSLFDELNNEFKILNLNNPKLASNILEKIPQLNENLAKNLFNFLQATKNAQPDKWIPLATLNALNETGENGKKISEKISSELLITSKITTETLGDWKLVNIPFLNGQTIQPISLFIKHLNNDDLPQNQSQKNQNSPSVRFLFEFELSEIGKTQIDGLTFPKEKQLNLIIRNEKKIPSEDIQNIQKIFSSTLENIKYTGTISFLQTNLFIKIDNKEKNEPHILNSDIWA